MPSKQHLWQYLQNTYGVMVSYCDSGWEIIYKGQRHHDGDLSTGMAKVKLGLPQNRTDMHRNILKVIENLYGLMYEQIHHDAALREMIASMKINSRRKVNDGQAESH